MIKRSVIIFVLILLLPLSVSAQQADSARLSALGMKLAEYYDAMVREPLDVQEQECDFLIESATDEAVRQFVALDIYRHYIDSPVMGAENVAVHVFDRWFASGLVDMSKKEYQDAMIYADFNRQSLIGSKAPQLTLITQDGQTAELFSGTSGDSPAKYSVVYFYDTDCAKCKLETIFLTSLFNGNQYPVTLYAVYAGDNGQAWENYLKENLVIMAPQTQVCHLWDPQFESDFQRKYGVTQTPRLYLVSPEGVILGRGLDAAALGQMLDEVFAPRRLEYGSEESEALFDGIFSMYEGKPGVSQVKGIADYISDKTLSAGDTLMFKQLSGDYLYYLSARSGEGYKEGLKYHIDKNIYSQSKVWRTQDDSLKVLGYADIMYDLLSKAAPGSKIPALKVPGELLTSRGEKSVCRRLNKLSGKENVIIFYTEGCEVCKEQKATARAMVGQTSGQKHRKSSDISVFMVNVDAIMTENPSLATRLMETFDLSSLPYIVMTDSEGVVLRRYLTL